MDAVAADFTEGLRPRLPQIAQALPLPVTGADVLSVDVGETESVAMIRYSGDTGDVTIRSCWQDEGGRPVIVHAGPLDRQRRPVVPRSGGLAGPLVAGAVC
jgi:hypothetical protein